MLEGNAHFFILYALVFLDLFKKKKKENKLNQISLKYTGKSFQVYLIIFIPFFTISFVLA